MNEHDANGSVESPDLADLAPIRGLMFAVVYGVSMWLFAAISLVVVVLLWR